MRSRRVVVGGNGHGATIIVGHHGLNPRSTSPMAPKYVAGSAAYAYSWPPRTATKRLGARAASKSRRPLANGITHSSGEWINSLGAAIDPMRSIDGNRCVAIRPIGKSE